MRHAVAIDIGDHVAISTEQRLRRAHFGARGKLPFRETIAAVFLELRGRSIGFRASCTERALVHFAADAEGAGLRKLRRAERARVETVAAADAEVLVVEHDTVLGLVE